MQAISFTALGKPEPAGSKRAFRHNKTGRVIVADANKNAKPWQSVVAAEGHEAMKGRALLDGPLAVRFVFFQPRPQGHYGTGRNRGLLRASAPAFPVVRPDLLKLARAVEDALTGVCYRDDAVIVSEFLAKVYGKAARVLVEIRPVSIVDVERVVVPEPCAPTSSECVPTDRPDSHPLNTDADIDRRIIDSYTRRPQEDLVHAEAMARARAMINAEPWEMD